MNELGDFLIDNALDYWVPKFKHGRFYLDDLKLTEMDCSFEELEQMLIQRAKAYSVMVLVQYDPINFRVIVDWTPEKK